MLGLVFREIAGRRREDDEIEMLDRQALCTRIGEPGHRQPTRPREDMTPLRLDGPRRSALRSWRDVAGLPR